MSYKINEVISEMTKCAGGDQTRTRECFSYINKWWRSMELSVPSCHHQHRRQIGYIYSTAPVARVFIFSPSFRRPLAKTCPGIYVDVTKGVKMGVRDRERVLSSLDTTGTAHTQPMVSGIAQWQASVLAINHGLPHCSPVNHRTRGTRELPSVK